MATSDNSQERTTTQHITKAMNKIKQKYKNTNTKNALSALTETTTTERADYRSTHQWLVRGTNRPAAGTAAKAKGKSDEKKNMETKTLIQTERQINEKGNY